MIDTGIWTLNIQSPLDYEITSNFSQLISFIKFIAAVHTETTLNIGITQQFNAMLIGQ